MHWLLFILLALVMPAQADAARFPLEQVDEWDKTYDTHFRKYSKRYFGPHTDWRWFKSQAIAESGLDPDVTSKAGAQGLMQIMPATFAEIRKRNAHFRTLKDPRWNIATGIYYDRYLYGKWRTPPPGQERLYFAFGSYNAGYGRIYQALKKASGSGRWHELKPHVPPQTYHYVKRIQRLMSTSYAPGNSLEQLSLIHI